MAQRPVRRKRRKVWRDNDAYHQMMIRMVRAYGRRVATTGAGEDLAALAHLSVVLDEVMADAVTDLHTRQRFTWQAIADAFGITRQAAQQRWGKQRSA